MDHALRRRALRGRMRGQELDAIVVTDVLNVRYLTGFTGSNAQLLVLGDDDVLLTDGRYEGQAGHEVPDLELFTYGGRFREALAQRLGTDGVRRLGFEAQQVTVAGHGQLTSALPEIELVATEGLVEELRVAKDADELEAIRRAQAATDSAFESILARFSIGVSERQIAVELERLLRDEGVDGVAFPSIVAFGERTAEPHHQPTHRLLEEGDVINLDFGGVVDGYHADMTRTIAFGSAPTELRKIHDIVREAQQAGVDAVKAGVTGAAVDEACRAPIAAAGYAEAFVHGTGHGVGLEIHEAPWLGKGHDGELPAGSIVTVEPGVYVPGLGGVRIEDMVEVGDHGGRVVGSSTRELIEL